MEVDSSLRMDFTGACVVPACLATPPPCAHACGNPRQRGGGGGCCWGLAEALELELHYRADQELAAAVELEELRQMNGNPQLEEARCVCQWQNPNPLLKLVFE